ADSPVGSKGVDVLNRYERFAYYGLILMGAAWFSIATVQEMIPGSKHKSSPGWTILATMLSLAVLVSVLFHNFSLDRFVSLGIPCLRLGSVCAVVSGARSWFLFRKGFFAKEPGKRAADDRTNRAQPQARHRSEEHTAQL